MALVSLLSILILAILFHYLGRGRVELLLEETALHLLRQTRELEEAMLAGTVVGDGQAIFLLQAHRSMSNSQTLRGFTIWSVLTVLITSDHKKRPTPWEAGNPALASYRGKFATTLTLFLLARHPVLAALLLGLSPFMSSRSLEERPELVDALSRVVPVGAAA